MDTILSLIILSYSSLDFTTHIQYDPIQRNEYTTEYEYEMAIVEYIYTKYGYIHEDL